MKKTSLLIISLMAVNMVYAEVSSDKKSVKPELIGGFSAPIFFTHYDQNLIDSICANRNNPKQVDVTYPSHLKTLAFKIIKGINKKCNIAIKISELNLYDTDKVKYRHDAVVVSMIFNNK
ncbi:MAG TPA: hypothetical protein PKD00_01040 [Burkholderiales bacterium]|nr:hypothetical protein [Burkholderiales bacterium]